MGLLKHVILPLATLIHLHAFYTCTSIDLWADLAKMPVETEIDTRQLHMLGCLRAFNAAMAFLCIFAVFKESAHFRGMIVIADAIIFSLASYDSYSLAGSWTIPGTIAAVFIVSAIIHSQEPGIFTKDKTTKQKKKK